MMHTKVHTKLVQKMSAVDEPSLFAYHLRERRKALRLTQADLAERAGFSFSAVQKLEGGQRHPSQQVAELLADALQIAPKERARFLRLAQGGVDSVDQRATPTNLPAYLTPLIGRDGSLQRVEALLRQEDVRLLTLGGPPGIGKTRLALQATRNLIPFFPDGVFLISLAPIQDAALVLGTVAGVLGLRESSSEPISLTLKEHLREQNVLLLLDNFEQVVTAAQLVVDLLWGCPQVKMLVTSREALHVRGERQYSLPPLDNEASVQLFTQRAQQVDAGFSLTEDNREAVREICARMEGVPLAIELVAARVRLLPPRTILARLGKVEKDAPAGSFGERKGSALPLLVGGARDLPDRHRTLSSAISWSYNLLESDERALFARLGVFVGGFTLSAVEAVCNAGGDLQMPTLDALESLFDKNLVKREEETQEETQAAGDTGEGWPRYMMLETIREYALERLVQKGQEGALRLLHAEYFLAIFSALSNSLVHERERLLLARLGSDYDNMRAAISWAIAAGRSDMAAHLGIALFQYWLTRSQYREGRSWLERIIAEQPDPSHMEPDARSKLAKILYQAGVMSSYLMDFSDSRQKLEASLRLFEEAGSEADIARVLIVLGNTARLQGDYSAAEFYYEKSVAIYRVLGDRSRTGVALWALGITVGESGDLDRGHSLLSEALALTRETGALFGEFGSLRDLAIVMGYAGRHEEAISLLEKSLVLARQAGFRVGISWALDALAFSVMRQGDNTRARRLYKEGLEIAREADQHRVADSLEGLAEIELTYARGEGALQRLERAAVLLGGAEAVRTIQSARVLPVKAPFRERLITEVCSCLGASDYDLAYQLGRRMSLEQAIDFALSEECEVGEDV